MGDRGSCGVGDRGRKERPSGQVLRAWRVTRDSVVSGWDGRSRRRNRKLCLRGGHPGRGLGRKVQVASEVWFRRGLPRSTRVGEAGRKGFFPLKRTS